MFTSQCISPKWNLLILASVCILHNSRSLAQPMIHNGNATAVYEGIINLTAGTTVRIETRNLSAGSDPVLNLLSPQNAEVASDDNSGNGYAASITYTPALSGRYILIVRSSLSSKNGSADIFVNGVAFQRDIRFGGWNLIIRGLRLGETIETVKLPNGAEGTHRIYILKGDGVGIEKRILDGGTDGAAFYKPMTTLGTKMIMISTNVNDTGAVRLVRNDAGIAGHDPDHDGLGTELEKEIGTCSLLSGYAKGFDCSLAVDARDTDGDGISDKEELLGRFPSQPLAKWGADPRHKDMFIEVDFMRTNGRENSITSKMSPEIARGFNAAYADSFTTSPWLQLYHAVILRNPDMKTGISVHLDTGVEPEKAADATVYGNWGGFSAVNAVKADGSPCDMNTPDNKCQGVAPDQKDGVYKQFAWKDNMAKVRRGIFRYAMGYLNGGGQSDDVFGCAFNITSAANAVHEWGHTLGLGHSGRYYFTGYVDINGKPNYRSTMNYAFNFDPNYFADGQNAPALNNSALKEWEAVPTFDEEYLTTLENVFKYYVDKERGHVDWNRDGKFAPAGTLVRAFANFRPGNEPEITRYNQVIVPGSGTTISPAMARINDRLYLFYATDSKLNYTYSTSSWNCPVPDIAGCNGGSWMPEKFAGFASFGVTVTNTSSNELLVVSIDGHGNLWERRLTIVFGIEKWTPVKRIPVTASGEPSFVIGMINEPMLLYKGPDMKIHYTILRSSGQWEADKVALQTNGEPILSTDLWASPSGIQACLPSKAGLQTYGFFPDPAGLLNIWCYNGTTQRWEAADIFEDRHPGPIYGRAAMATVPFEFPTTACNRLYLLYVRQPAATIFNAAIRMRFTYVKVTTNPDGSLQKTEKLGMDAFFDNSSLVAKGAALLYEPGKDNNLRAVFTGGNLGNPNENKLVFRPNADGILDFTYTNHNDWETIGICLCNRVVNPDGLASNPIKCRPQQPKRKDWNGRD